MFGYKFSRVLTPLTVAAGLLFGASQASAHVIAIGYSAGANAGELNLWLGSYHANDVGDGPNLEGSARLQGLGALAGYDTTTAFTVSEGVNSYTNVAPPPSGLVLGTNLFTTTFYSGGNNADPSAIADIYSWEAALVTGLTAGDYTFTYVPIATPSQHWAPYPDIDNITLTLTAGDTSGGGTTAGTQIPEPMTLGILGLGLAGIGFARRKRAA